MINEKDRSIIGKEAANKGIANEHIALGILMHRYNASKVDLPSSKYDIIIELKKNDYIRIQSKASDKSISFLGNVRAGKANKGSSNLKYSYRYNVEHCDIIMGVKTSINKKGVLEKVDLYFMPTLYIETLKQNSISYGRIESFKNNWNILENSKDFNYVKKFLIKNN